MLTAKRVARLLKQKPGRHRDDFGLYLQVTNPRNASWLFRFQRHGVEHWLGLGPVHAVTLAEARIRAKAARLSLVDGVNPLHAKRAAKAAEKLAAVRRLTFSEAAKQYHRSHMAEWKSSQHANQWLRSLEVYAFPIIGNMDVGEITRPDVLRVLEPIWQTRTVTADRVRNRIETIWSWASARGHRTTEGANPAAWTGSLDKVLPAVRKVAAPVHHAALPYDELPAFMAKLRQQDSIAARALEFAILTAARSGEALDAVWSEVDLDGGMWVIPASRMKSGREHRVVLSGPALDLLRALPREANSPYLFIGSRAGRSVSNASIARLLKVLHDGSITFHGFRSAFSTWAHEMTGFDHHTIEVALSHSVGNTVAQAYQRGELLDKRRQLMNAWGRYCTSEPVAAGNVVPIGEGTR